MLISKSIATVILCTRDLYYKWRKTTIAIHENFKILYNIFKLTDSDEQGIFLLKLTAISEERIVQLFLDPSHKPEGLYT